MSGPIEGKSALISWPGLATFTNTPLCDRSLHGLIVLSKKSVPLLSSVPITSPLRAIAACPKSWRPISRAALIPAVISILEVEINEENPQVIYISIDGEFNFLDDISVSFYEESQLESIFDQFLPTFYDFPVYNNISERIIIPGFVQAEDYIYQEGLSIEETSDSGGGLNIGYTHTGDYADYLVLVTESGEYEINFRVSSENQSGSILLQLINGANIQNLTQISIPITGGWQSWETISAISNLNEGSYKLRMKVIQPGFNLNWIEFENISGLGYLKNEINSFKIYPNPSSNIINIHTDLTDFKIEIYDTLGKKIHNSINKYSINIDHFESGFYVVKLISGVSSISKILLKE